MGIGKRKECKEEKEELSFSPLIFLSLAFSPLALGIRDKNPFSLQIEEFAAFEVPFIRDHRHWGRCSAHLMTNSNALDRADEVSFIKFQQFTRSVPIQVLFIFWNTYKLHLGPGLTREGPREFSFQVRAKWSSARLMSEGPVTRKKFSREGLKILTDRFLGVSSSGSD